MSYDLAHSLKEFVLALMSGYERSLKVRVLWLDFNKVMPTCKIRNLFSLRLFKQLLKSSLGEGKNQMEAQENKSFVKVLVKFLTESPTPPLDLRKGPSEDLALHLW